MLEIEDLHAFYGDVRALRGVGISVGAGEVVAILGANGAGKSTLMRSIMNLHTSKRGRISFASTDITALGTHEIVKLGLALVPEHRQVFGQMTVHENLLMGGYLSGRKDNARTAGLLFELFPVLAARRSQMAGTLSGGEQQMLAIGRGLMSKPSLLALDEPSMGLAPLVVQELYVALRQLVEAGETTILLVEQNAREALGIAQRVYVMQRGAVVQESDSETARAGLLDSYLRS